MDSHDVPTTNCTGDELLAALSALANPHRLRVIAALAVKPTYVSLLARELGIGRPLLHMHLQRLESAGLVTSRLELGDDGKAMRYFEVTPFVFGLTPGSIARAVETLSSESTKE